MATEAPAPVSVFDKDAELAKMRDELDALNRLSVSEAAKAVPGHRPGPEIEADLKAAKQKLNTMLLEKDRLHLREIKEKKLRDGQKALATQAHRQAGVPFVEAEWTASQPPVYVVPADFLKEFHKQHLIVAKFEKERDALLKAVGPHGLI